MIPLAAMPPGRRAPARRPLAVLLAAALALYVGTEAAGHIHMEESGACVWCVSGHAVAAERPLALVPFVHAAGQAPPPLAPAMAARPLVQRLARGPPLSD